MVPPLQHLETYEPLREDFSPEAWDGLSRSLAAQARPSHRRAPDPAYFLSSYFSYQPKDAQGRLLELLRSQKAPSQMVWEMERTAKARHQGAFGQALHRLFLQRHRPEDYLSLPAVDDTGDRIFFPKKSPSARTWAQVGWSHAPERPDLAVAQTLSRFVSIDWQEGTDIQGVWQFLLEAENFYARGFPLPPHLVLKGPMKIVHDRPKEDDLTITGTYENTTDTLSLDSRNPQLAWTWAHEAGHFLMDVLDDRHGPNSDSLAPLRTDGALLFDPVRCGLLEHVSAYPAAYCSIQASPARLYKKMSEDLAETFAYAYTHSPEWDPQGPSLAMEMGRWMYFSPAILLADLENVLQLLLKDPSVPILCRQTAGFDPLVLQRNWESLGQQMIELLDIVSASPPHLSNSAKSWDPDFLRALLTWVRELRLGPIAEAEKVRLEKIRWMDSLILLGANTDFSPWELGARLSFSK